MCLPRETGQKVGSDRAGPEKSSTSVLFRLVLTISSISRYYIESSGLPNLPLSILESSGDLQQIPETRPHPKQSADETGNQSFWSSMGLGTTDIKYRNQIDLPILPFEIYPGHHSRELTKGRKEGRKGGRNKGTNTKPMHYFLVFVFLKKIICTYTPCCSWRWLHKALKKSLSRYMAHDADMSLYCTASSLQEGWGTGWWQKGESLITNSKRAYADSKVTTTAS